MDSGRICLHREINGIITQYRCRKRFLKNRTWQNLVGKKRAKRRELNSGLIPCELLPKGRRLRRSGSPRTYPYRLLPSHFPRQLPMQDIRSHRFRIRYISLCQRLLPTHSLQHICFGEKKKRVSILTHVHQETRQQEDRRSSNSSHLHQKEGVDKAGNLRIICIIR